MPLTTEQKRLLREPYSPFSKTSTFQVGNRKLTVRRVRQHVPTKFVRGLDRLKVLQTDIPNISGKKMKSCRDCVWCYEDRTMRSQVLTNKQVNYRCQRGHGTPYIDPNTFASSPEKWMGQLDRQCPDFVHRKRFK